MQFYQSCANMFKLSMIQNRYAPLAQLDRASGYGPEGQGFESLTACQKGPSHSGWPFLAHFFKSKGFESCPHMPGACAFASADTGEYDYSFSCLTQTKRNASESLTACHRRRSLRTARKRQLQKSRCLFLICAACLLLSKSNPRCWASIWYRHL